MSDRIKLVQGDTRPDIKVTLTDASTGDPVIITGATVRLKFRAAESIEVLATLIGSVIDGANGVVAFPWGPGDLDVDPGEYEGEIEVTFANGAGVQTVYDKVKFRVREQF